MAWTRTTRPGSRAPVRHNAQVKVYELYSEQEMHELARLLVRGWKAGDVVLLEGPLGAGKTTFVRGALKALGWFGDVRSPSFNLLQIYETEPQVAHADLYRVKSADGIGLEAYLDSHLCFIEWPDRFSLLPHEACWKIQFEFLEGPTEGRSVTLISPTC